MKASHDAALRTLAPPASRCDDESVRFGPFRFDRANGLLYRDDQQVVLPPRALGVLSLLVQKSGQLVGKRELLDTVWKDVMVEEASLKEAISSLRQTLGDDPKQPAYIQTVHRRGYRFVAAIEGAVDAPPPATHGPGLRVGPTSRWAIAGIVLGVLLLGALLGAAGSWLWKSRAAAGAGEGVVRFAVVPPAGDELGDTGAPSLAIAPDGSRFAFVARHGESSRLYLQSFDDPVAVPVAGSDGALAPFFSPDGTWVGFCAGATLKVAPVGGGGSTSLATINECDGASWGPRGRIVVGSEDGLWSVSEKGAAPVPLTRIDPGKGQVGHWWPQILPDGTVLFTVWRTGLNDAEIALLRPGAADYQTVFKGATDPLYLPDGRLLVARESGVMALPFDLAAGQVTGEPVAAVPGALVDTFMGFAQLAVAANGTRVMITGKPHTSARIVWADESGNLTPTALRARDYRNAALSRDGLQLAVTINDPNNYDIWLGDLSRGSLTRLTTRARNTQPVWSPDGQWVAYASSAEGPISVLRRRADGSGDARQIAFGPEPRSPTSFSPDGRWLAFNVTSADGNDDIQVVRLDGVHEPEIFLHTPGNEAGAQFSPDGHWIAYVSDASGRFPGDFQVFLRAFPARGPALRVSTGSGLDPYWSPDGRFIYYKNGFDVMKVAVAGADPPRIGQPRKLFEAPDQLLRGISPDGKRLLLIDRQRRDGSVNRLLVELR